MATTTVEDVLERLSPEGVQRMKQEMLEDVLDVVTEAAAAAMPRRTGALAEKTRYKVVKTGEWGVVKPGKFYGKFIHEGTKAHELKPKRRKKLRAMVIEGEMYSRARHPGVTRTVKFFPLALEATRDTVEEIMEDSGETLFAKVAYVRRPRKRKAK